MSLYAHYDPETDIVLLRVDAEATHGVSEETEFGLRDVDDRNGRVVGLELWRASERLPADVLALIEPPAAAV